MEVVSNVPTKPIEMERIDDPVEGNEKPRCHIRVYRYFITENSRYRITAST